MKFWTSLLASLVLVAGVSAADSTITNSPVKKFRLPQFNEEGYRTGLLEGDEASLISQTQIDIKEMHFTVFSADDANTVDTTILAPTATIRIPDQQHALVEGKGPVRVVRSDLDASGENWTYLHAEKKIIMRNHVHVVFRSELTDLLK